MSQSAGVPLQNLSPSAPVAPAVHPTPILPAIHPSSPNLPAQSQHNQPQHSSCWTKLKTCLPTRVQVMDMLLPVLSLLGLLVALIAFVPGFQGTKYGKESVRLAKESLELDVWQSKVAFRAWCQDEMDAGRTLTGRCEDAVSRPLPPPPHTKRSLLEAFLPNGTTSGISITRSVVAVVTGGALLFWLFKTVSTTTRCSNDDEVLPTSFRRNYYSQLFRSIGRSVRGDYPPPRAKKKETTQTQIFSPPDVSSIDFTFKGDDSGLRQRKPQGKQREPKWMELCQAAANGHEAVVRLLVDKGTNINAKDPYGLTALHQAAANGHEAVVQLLMNKGADVNAKSSSRLTALHQASANGHEA
ncbi:ankyrin, partial [Byssothecium circinans]